MKDVRVFNEAFFDHVHIGYDHHWLFSFVDAEYFAVLVYPFLHHLKKKSCSTSNLITHKQNGRGKTACDAQCSRYSKLTGKVVAKPLQYYSYLSYKYKHLVFPQIYNKFDNNPYRRHCWKSPPPTTGTTNINMSLG